MQSMVQSIDPQGAYLTNESSLILADDNCGKLDCGWTNAFGTVVPSRCGKRGVCMSLAQAASLHTDIHGEPDHTVTYNTSWESERIQ
jgi:hypothetical protein